MSKRLIRLAAASMIVLLVVSALMGRMSIAWAGENQIERLARKHFPEKHWTECEKNLLEHVSTGEVANCGSEVPEDPDKEKMQFDVGAEVIRWLCIDPAAIKLIDPRGIQLHAARVVGPLSLSFVTVPFPLTFEYSRFAADINLVHSQLVNLDLTGSHTHGIAAYNSTVRNDFKLINTFRAEGKVSLDEAILGGDFEAEGGTFANAGNVALSANRLKAVNVYLNNRFHADGEVDLVGATLGGDLNAIGGSFNNPDKYALFAENLNAARVFLSNGFSADGEVDLVGAVLGGDLNGGGGTFKNRGKIALKAGDLRAVNVYLGDQFAAEGEVNFQGATLSGDLDADGGTFKNHGGDALAADEIKAVAVDLGSGFSAEGEVRLLNARLDGDLEADGGTFQNHGGDALSADGLKATHVYLRNRFNADGAVRLLGAILGNVLECEGGKFKNHGGAALNADSLKATEVMLDDGFTADGEVHLKGAILEGDLIADGGKFQNHSGDALNADGLKATNVLLDDGFTADGEVHLQGAILKGDLIADGGTFNNHGHDALSADQLKAANVLVRNGFNADGEVRLLGANLEGDLQADGGTFYNHGRDALSADQLKAANVYLRDGFKADGDVRLPGADLEGDLDTDGGSFRNPGGDALDASLSNIAGSAYSSDLSAVGGIDFIAAQVKGEFYAPIHSDDVALDLSHATVGPLFDDEKGWPRQGNLTLDGFVYSRFGGGPADYESRLDWLGRQNPKKPSLRQRLVSYTRHLFVRERQKDAESSGVKFRPQPYEQLAKVLRENGDDAGATSVLIAMEDARWWDGKIGFWERCWSGVLWVTIGYGYDIWRALWFIGGFVILGASLFYWGQKSEAIVQLEPEKTEHFLSFNCLVYSLETFLPLVELHQAKFWGPDPEPRPNRPRIALATFKPLSGYHHQFGPAFGKYLRWYLWIHIMAGWFFTSMLIAGITGLAQKV